METVIRPLQNNTHCTIITVYNMEGEVVHKQFSNCDHLSVHQISSTKKFMEGVYFIIFQNRSLIRMERMVVN